MLGMAVEIQRKVEFSMIDMANVAYYPRIFDLAHKVFEQAWEAMCDVSYPSLVNERRVGFPWCPHLHLPCPTSLRRYDHSFRGHFLHRNDLLGWTYTFVNQHGETVWTSQQATVCVGMTRWKNNRFPTTCDRV